MCFFNITHNVPLPHEAASKRKVFFPLKIEFFRKEKRQVYKKPVVS